MNQLLPAQFAEFENLAAVWSLATERERHTARLTAEFDQLQSLYDAVLPKVEEIVSHLNLFPMDALPAPEQNLLNLALSCMEVALSVEAHGQTTVPGGFDPARFEVDF